jgi:hypothetical protein
MRFFTIIPVLAALITAVAAVPTNTVCASEIGCDTPTPPSKRDFFEHPSRDEHAVTNANLLRRGLPLKEPILRRGSPVRRSSPSSVPPVKITHRGTIEVHNAANGNLLGYVSKNLVNGGAQYGIDPTAANALHVTFDTDQSNSGTGLNVKAVDSNPSWPLLGIVQGRDDIDSNVKPGSYQYLYLGGVANPGTQPGDRPAQISNSYFIGSPRTAETALWTINSAGNMSPIWINQDGTTPALQLWTQSTGLYAGGDMNAFFARYPAPVIAITYKFIPA